MRTNSLVPSTTARVAGDLSALFADALSAGDSTGAGARQGWVESRLRPLPAIPQRDPDTAPADWETAGAQWLTALSETRLSALASWPDTKAAVLHLRGLPLEEPRPPSPYSGRSHFRTVALTLLKLFGVVRLIGARAIAYEGEGDGCIYRDVVAREGAREERSSQGWGRELPWHTDCAYRPLTETDLLQREGLSPAPRWLVFGVVYESPSVPMTVVSVADVVASLGERHARVLSSPLFDVSSPQSFGSTRMTHALPILVPDQEGGHFVRFNRLGCRGTTPDAQLALEALARVLDDPACRCRITLTAGDVIVLDNWRAIHMRSAYQPRWDGTDRWLIRLYACPATQQGISESSLRERVWI